MWTVTTHSHAENNFWLLLEKQCLTQQGKASDLNKSEEIVENTKFHSPSSDTEREKLPTVIHPPPPHLFQ